MVYLDMSAGRFGLLVGAILCFMAVYFVGFWSLQYKNRLVKRFLREKRLLNDFAVWDQKRKEVKALQRVRDE